MIKESDIYRVIDANFNRSKEGLRVTEEFFRFVIKDDNLREKLRRLRHRLDEVLKKDDFLKKLLQARNIQKDSGKKSDELEFSGRDKKNILFVNFQRIKESLRVLEEFFKIIDKDKAKMIKKMRFQIYEIEKDAFLRTSLCNS